MILEHINSKHRGKFLITIHEPAFDWDQSSKDHLIHIIWNNSEGQVELELDGALLQMPPKSMITTTYYHKLRVIRGLSDLIIFSFNREFYCIYDHDDEVSCNGIIFFGAQRQTLIRLDSRHEKKLSLLLQVFRDEFEYRDSIQGEMLVMLLKRLIIICTRLTRDELGYEEMQNDQMDIVRQFHFLVDKNFREVKSVKAYADLLHRSPKTLSNIFSKLGDKTPLQIIHERTVLEARRLLTFSDKNINEITDELGFEESATFFKLFKKYMNESPQSFRETYQANRLGKMDISSGTFSVT